VFEQQEGAHSHVRLQRHCRGTHLQKEVENKFYGLKPQGTTKELERLTLQGFPKILDLLEKEFFAILRM
jgi:hypothetical protein